MALKAHLASQPVPAQSSGLGAQTIDSRRQPRRTLHLETSGRLPSGAQANVTIHNLSAAGLLLETDLQLGVGEVLAIDMPDTGPIGAEIVWQSGHLFGCAFQQALGEAALAAAQLRGNAGPAGSAPVGGAPQNSPQNFGTSAGGAFGLRLNRLRRERGLTLAQVAAKLGVSKPTVWAWEKAKARPLPERIAAIAEALGVAEADLMSVADASGEGGGAGSGAALVEDCRLRIATAYGTNPKSVRIMIEV